MARTQAERRSETRQRLLDAAAALIAQRGVAGTSVDAIADAADRTSGAVYDHFGGKDGLLVALLDRWKDAAGAVITAELEASTSPEERLASLWRALAEPADGGEEWVMLEHELWLHARRQPAALPLVAERYAGARAGLAGVLSGVDDPAAHVRFVASDDAEAVARAERDEGAALVLALLLGLEMQRRLDPGVVPDELAVRGLRALLDATR